MDYREWVGKPLVVGLIEEPVLAVVKLATQPAGVVQQVVLRRDKVSPLGQLVRFGETSGDEATCWIEPGLVMVVEVLGRVDLETLEVTPIEYPSAPVVRLETA